MVERVGICGVWILLGLVGPGCGDDAGEEPVRQVGDAAAPGLDAGPPASGGDAGPAAPPADGRMSSEAAIRDACDFLVSCGGVPGPALTFERCEAEVGDACVQCIMQQAEATAEGGGDAGEGPCDLPAGRAGACDDACTSLVGVPTNSAECLAIVSERTPGPECFCDSCLEDFATCVDDGDCLRIARCCTGAGVSGLACFWVPECMAIITELGPTSLSTALAIRVGECLADNACGEP